MRCILQRHTANNAVNLVPMLKKELSKIRTVLTRYSRYKSAFIRHARSELIRKQVSIAFPVTSAHGTSNAAGSGRPAAKTRVRGRAYWNRATYSGLMMNEVMTDGSAFGSANA